MAAKLMSAKVPVFYSKIAKTSPKSSQRFYLAQTLIKSIKPHISRVQMNYLLLNRSKKQRTKIKMKAVLVSAKVSVFYSKCNKTFPKSSQRFYLAETLIKHKKHDQNRGQINYLLLNSRKNQGIKIKLGCLPTSAIV